MDILCVVQAQPVDLSTVCEIVSCIQNVYGLQICELAITQDDHKERLDKLLVR